MANLNIKPLGYALGAEVSGFDARKPVPPALREELLHAWYQYQVLVFPAQPLSMTEQIAFSRNFGDVDRNDMAPRYRDPDHHEIVYITNKTLGPNMMSAKRVGRKWHADATFALRPQKGALLRCVEKPPVGGDTMWANMYLAYETLSPAMRAFLDPLECVHDVSLLPGAQESNGNSAEHIAEFRRINPPVIHPLIPVIPETGRKTLFLGWVREILGLSLEESAAIIAFLDQHAGSPEFVFRHRWSVDDIVLWDNRCTRHIALPDYDHSKTRHMLRTTLLGEQPGRLAEGRGSLGNRETLLEAVQAVS